MFFIHLYFTDQVTIAHRNFEINFCLTTTPVSQYQNHSIPQYLQVPALVSAQPPLPRQVRPGTRFPIITIFITNSYQYVYQHDHHPPVYQHLYWLFWTFFDVPEVKFDKKNSIIGKGRVQKKISLLSPLFIGSNLTFAGCCSRRLPYSAMFIVTLNAIYT